MRTKEYSSLPTRKEMLSKIKSWRLWKLSMTRVKIPSKLKLIDLLMSIWPRLFRKKKPERLSSKLKWFSETSWLQLIRRRMQMFQFSSCINSSSRGRNQFIKVSTWCTKKEMQTEMFLKFIKHFAGFHLKITSQSLQIKWWLTIIWRDWISQSWILILLDYKESIYQLLIKAVNSWGSSSKLLTLMEHPHTKRSIQPYSQLSPSHSFSV